MNIEIKKKNIIEQIMSVADEQVIDQIGHHVSQLVPEKEAVSMVEDTVAKYRTTIRKEFDLEEIKRAQNYTGIDAEKMYRLIEEADIQEPIEELLKMI